MPYPNQHACRLRDPGDFQEGSFRTMHRDHEGKQYAVIVGKLKEDSAMTEQAYRYDKETWTADAAKNHCNSHDGSFVAADDRPGPNEENIMQGIYFKAQTDSAEIWIYDEIGSGWFGGMSAKQFADEFKKLGKVENISLRINSPGGDVFDGLAIYNLLKQSKARIIVNIDGLAASIASIIAMAGDEINMAENAIMMIHKAWGMSIGNADEMAKMAETLTKLDSTLASTYAKQTGLDLGAISQMMADETWMNSQEAMAFGFITNITDEMKLAAHFDLAKYKFKKNPLADRVPMQPGNRLEGTGTPMRSETGAPLRTGDNGMEILETAISKCESIINRS